MKAFFITFLMLTLAKPISAAVDEGVVTWVDGKGGFEVKTERNGTLVLQASPKLMADELWFKQNRWPHLYKDIKPGDYISFDWHKEAKTFKPIANFVGIKKRKG